MATMYGIVSDAHTHPWITAASIKILADEGVKRFIVNGDITGNAIIPNPKGPRKFESMSYVAVCLNAIAATAEKHHLDVWIQPGSHESFMMYGITMQTLRNRTGIHDAVYDPIIEASDHRICLLPGSDIGPGEYKIADDLPKTYGRIQDLPYIGPSIGELSKEASVQFRQDANGLPILTHFFRPQDLEDRIKVPESSILVCHVPPRFSASDAPDIADYWIAYDYTIHKGNSVLKGSILPYAGNPALDQELPVKRVISNRGNESLAEVIRELGITKTVCGHFHESCGNAIDNDQHHIKPMHETPSLHLNASLLDDTKAAILYVDGQNVMYNSIDLYQLASKHSENLADYRKRMQKNPEIISRLSPKGLSAQTKLLIRKLRLMSKDAAARGGTPLTDSLPQDSNVAQYMREHILNKLGDNLTDNDKRLLFGPAAVSGSEAKPPAAANGSKIIIPRF